MALVCFYLALLVSVELVLVEPSASRNGYQEAAHISRNICYPGVGCFSSTYPYNNTASVPLSPEFIGTQFTLITREQRTPRVLHTASRGSIIHSTFNPHHPTKIIIHGFLATGFLPWIRSLTEEFLRKEPMNIIAVDWGRGAGFPYPQAAANTRLVGIEISGLILFLNHETGSELRDFHLIGHSLGAHVAGITGQRLPGISRISGLDPAQPNFQGESIAVRLDPTDALFVDVIHTDGSQFEELGGFGMSEASGHIDFYPNGGVQQPGCPEDGWFTFMHSAYREGVQAAESLVGCNHNRVNGLFIESVNSACPFTAYPCTNMSDFAQGKCFHCHLAPCPSMGYSASPSHTSGKYFLYTNPTAPYCGYHYSVELHLGEDMEAMTGEIKVHLYGSQGHSKRVQLFSGNLQGGTILKGVVFSESPIGQIEDVRLTFERVHGYIEYISSFWQVDNGIHVHRLTAMPAWTDNRTIFCPRTGRLHNGGSLWLTHGTSEINSSC